MLILLTGLSYGPTHDILVGESFQDYSWIQDFEADFT